MLDARWSAWPQFSSTRTVTLTVPVRAGAWKFTCVSDAATGVGIAPANLFPGAGFAPAKPGQVVTLYGTGFGLTTPAIPPGDFVPSIARVTGNTRVVLGGVELAPSDLLYAGVAPNSPGLYQVNLRIPPGTRNGDLPLFIEIGGLRSPDGGYLTVAGAN